jgi:transcriptional regulator with XRE-family HTH domain
MENQWVDWITGELKERGWSGRELARRTGVSNRAVVKLLSGTPPSWDFCVALAKALNISVAEVFVRTGKLTRTQLLSGVPWLLSEERIQTLQQISAMAQLLGPQDQVVVLRVVRALLREE